MRVPDNTFLGEGYEPDFNDSEEGTEAARFGLSGIGVALKANTVEPVLLF